MLLDGMTVEDLRGWALWFWSEPDMTEEMKSLGDKITRLMF